ncbi:MAG: hypothetical protein Q4F05_07960 [bacterium]|nr:hypothetical protein [bacterium]
MKKVIILSLSLLFVIMFSGCGTAASGTVQKDTGNVNANSYTFYATIHEISSSGQLQVSGLDINDINYRGKFTISTTDQTKFIWRGTDISINDLKPDDIISIQFSGEVKETYPASLTADKIYYLGDRLDNKNE